MTALALLTDRDLPWIEAVLDLLERCVGQPWRLALERLDDLQRADQPTTPRRFATVVAATQRLTGGRVRNARAAREARSLVLGRPVLGAVERQARIAAAAEQLGVAPAALETLLWCDLPRERPVELPYGRPSELEVAALANMQLIQRALRRAQSITLRTSDDPGPLLRTAARAGLLATASRSADGTTTLDVVGPLALFHRTSVYSRALGELVPLLGELRQFELELLVETQTAMYTMHVASPVLLPAATPARLAAVPYPIARLARQLARAAPELAVTPLPPPLAADTAIVCPDLVIERDGARVYVELVGFWTAEHVRKKLATYLAAGEHVILCVDASGACDDDDHPAEALPFTKHVDAAEILGALEEKWGTLCS